MKKIILGLFIILFCLSLGVAQELSKAHKKELDEFLWNKGLLVGEAYEKALDNFLRSKGFLWEGFTPKVETMELMLREIIRHNIEGKGIEPHDFSWFEKSKEFYYKTCTRLERETLLKKQEEENARLQRLIWELDAVKSDIRLELDFMRDYYLFMPYLWNSYRFYPSYEKYFTMPNWTNYFWLNYYRR